MCCERQLLAGWRRGGLMAGSSRVRFRAAVPPVAVSRSHPLCRNLHRPSRRHRLAPSTCPTHLPHTLVPHSPTSPAHPLQSEQAAAALFERYLAAGGMQGDDLGKDQVGGRMRCMCVWEGVCGGCV